MIRTYWTVFVEDVDVIGVEQTETLLLAIHRLLLSGITCIPERVLPLVLAPPALIITVITDF